MRQQSVVFFTLMVFGNCIRPVFVQTGIPTQAGETTASVTGSDTGRSASTDKGGYTEVVSNGQLYHAVSTKHEEGSQSENDSITQSGKSVTKEGGAGEDMPWDHKNGNAEASNMKASTLTHQPKLVDKDCNDKNSVGSGDKSKDHGPSKAGTLHRKRLVLAHGPGPSIQLVILVIGAVLGCVILTGFIRWRVRTRIEAKKHQLSRELHNQNHLFGGDASSMATIYECECEDSHDSSSCLATVHTTELRSPATNQRQTTRTINKLPRSSSRAARAICNDHRLRRRDRLREGFFSHRSPKRRVGQRSSRRGRDFSRDCEMSSFPTPQTEEDRRTASDREHSFTPLLSNGDIQDAGESPSQEQSPTAAPLSTRPAGSSPRGVLASLINSWRSLSFNRDWVGRMWMEQHNVRRVSDVLRQGSGSQHNEDEEQADEEAVSEDSVTLDPDPSATYLVLPTSESPTVSNSSETNDQTGDEDARATNSHECPAAMPLQTWPLEDGDSHSHGGLWPTRELVRNSKSATTLTGDSNTVSETVSCECRGDQSVGDDGSAAAFARGDHMQEPPQYSLLNSGSHSDTLPHEHEHRRHRNGRRSRIRQMAGQHYFMTTPISDLGIHLARSPTILHGPDSSRQNALVCGSHPVGLAQETALPSTPVATTTSRQHSDTVRGEDLTLPQYGSAAVDTRVPPLVRPCSPLEGVVIEQLADGSQIILMPPPVLPSYHDDFPPPYQQ